MRENSEKHSGESKTETTDEAARAVADEEAGQAAEGWVCNAQRSFKCSVCKRVFTNSDDYATHKAAHK